ncbi:MAG: S8 family serine peptidase [Stellaceae bacterium]
MDLSQSRPAWTSPFSRETLRRLSRTLPLDDITPEWAWGGSTGGGVRVAVIDSGIDAEHPAIGGVQGYAEIVESGGGLALNTAVHNDVYGHGTACAGIIRATAPDCELYSVRALKSQLTGGGAVFIAAIRWCIEERMQVCNLSLGTTKRELFAALHQLTDLAYHRNIMLVSAANNMPIASFPSTYASVFSVASHGEPDSALFFYNPEPPVEFGARGMNVRVAWQAGGWTTVTGNSFAAPHITGLIARILGKHPDLTPFQMKSILRALAANVGIERQEPP